MSVYEDIKTGLEQAIAYEKENNTKKEKAILVIDMPKSCNECKIRCDDDYSNWCPYDNPEPGGVWEYVKKETKPDWCPLKPMPEKYNINNIPHDRDYDCEYEYGYNACIDEILGLSGDDMNFDEYLTKELANNDELRKEYEKLQASAEWVMVLDDFDDGLGNRELPHCSKCGRGVYKHDAGRWCTFCGTPMKNPMRY